MNTSYGSPKNAQILREVQQLLVQFVRSTDDNARSETYQQILDLLMAAGPSVTLKPSYRRILLEDGYKRNVTPHPTSKKSLDAEETGINFMATPFGQAMLSSYTEFINNKSLGSHNRLRTLVDWYYVYGSHENYVKQEGKSEDNIIQTPLETELLSSKRSTARGKKPKHSGATIQLDAASEKQGAKKNKKVNPKDSEKSIPERYAEAFVAYALNQSLRDLQRFGVLSAAARLFIEPTAEVNEYAPVVLYLALAVASFYFGYRTVGISATVFAITEIFELNDSYHDELLANLAIFFDASAAIYVSVRQGRLPTWGDTYNAVSSAWVAADVIVDGYQQESEQ